MVRAKIWAGKRMPGSIFAQEKNEKNLKAKLEKGGQKS
jgi:hypothetical protein